MYSNTTGVQLCQRQLASQAFTSPSAKPSAKARKRSSLKPSDRRASSSTQRHLWVGWLVPKSNWPSTGRPRTPYATSLPGQALRPKRFAPSASPQALRPEGEAKSIRITGRLQGSSLRAKQRRRAERRDYQKFTDNFINKLKICQQFNN